MRQLPPEIELLILQELEERHRCALRNCALVCKSWRKFCLPALFYELAINMDSGRHLPACSSLLTDSPHLCRHVRKVTFECDNFPIYVDDHEERMIKSILLGLTRLDELRCSWIPLTTLSSVLPQLSITTFYLKADVYFPVVLLPVLEAVASTVRSLTLEELIFGDELTMDDFASTISGGPICMTALEDLAIVLCQNLPFASRFIRMPNLKTIYCAGEDATLGDSMPSLINTFVVAETEVSDDFKPLSVDNLCIRWWRGNRHYSLSDAVEHAITTFTVPSKIKHIEIFLSPKVRPLNTMLDKLDQLETCALNLHRSGSFERLTITAEADILPPGLVDNMMPNLSSLGLLDVWTGRPSVLYPRCVDLAVGWE